MLQNLNAKSPARRLLVIARLLCVIALLCFTYCGGSQDAAAQFGGIDGGGGGGIDGGAIGGGGDLTGSDFGGQDNGGGGGTGTGGSGNFGDDFGNVLGGAETDNQRNQGFVGATGTVIQENGFIGSPGETSGPPLVDGANFGGGTNDVGSTGGGGGGGGGNNQNRNNGFGGTGETKGFEVFRSSVRANLRPRFSFPQVSGSQIANRFQNRVRRLPGMTNDGSNVQISISNQTATIQGFVGSTEEGRRIERQLRLEPGVYKIDNQATIIGQ